MAQIKRGVNPAGSLHLVDVKFTGGLVGAGAAIMTLTPTTVLLAKDNFCSSTTRTSTGLFVATMKEMPALVLDIRCTLYNSAGTTLYASMRSWDAVAKTITFDVRDDGAGSAVADPTSGDNVRIVVWGRNSTA